MKYSQLVLATCIGHSLTISALPALLFAAQPEQAIVNSNAAGSSASNASAQGAQPPQGNLQQPQQSSRQPSNAYPDDVPQQSASRTSQDALMSDTVAGPSRTGQNSHHRTNQVRHLQQLPSHASSLITQNPQFEQLSVHLPPHPFHYSDSPPRRETSDNERSREPSPSPPPSYPISQAMGPTSQSGAVHSPASLNNQNRPPNYTRDPDVHSNGGHSETHGPPAYGDRSDGRS